VCDLEPPLLPALSIVNWPGIHQCREFHLAEVGWTCPSDGEWRRVASHSSAVFFVRRAAAAAAGRRRRRRRCHRRLRFADDDAAIDIRIGASSSDVGNRSVERLAWWVRGRPATGRSLPAVAVQRCRLNADATVRGGGKNRPSGDVSQKLAAVLLYVTSEMTTDASWSAGMGFW